ncbi:MAG: HAD family hydrolase [Anaerolineae bacterium]
MLTILIDADDTLWESNIYYQRCSANLEEWLSGFGITREAVAATIAHYDQEVIKDFGYSPLGYIEALARTTTTLLGQAGLEVTEEHLSKTRSFGEPMLHPPIELMPKVESTLAILAKCYRLVLVTKGDRVLQQRKLERSGLSAYFQQVYILDEKDAASYRRILELEQTDPALTFMVGNSPKSDINPAVAAGLRAVYIPHDHTWTAEHEDIPESPRIAILDAFADLPAYFETISQ